MTVANWAGCLASVVAGVRARYNATAAFVAGTYTVDQEGTSTAHPYVDFLRYRLGGAALYGNRSTSWGVPYYSKPAKTAPPFPPAEHAALADARYETRSGRAVQSWAEPDPGNSAHFSASGYDTMGRRYFTAFLRAGGGPVDLIGTV